MIEHNDTIDNANQYIQFDLSFADKWILSRYNSTIEKINEHLNDYKVTEYSKLIYDFIWRDFCDWYVEILKVQLNLSSDKEYRKKLTQFSTWLYENIMKILHPIMPFITEEIYHLISERLENDSISTTAFPTSDKSKIDYDVETQFELVQNIVEEIRKLRASINMPSQKLPATISVPDETTLNIFNNVKPIIINFGKFSELNIGINLSKPEGCTSTVYRGIEIHLVIKENIDIDKEKQRLGKEITRLEGNIRGCESKLNNEKFMAGASPEIIAREREKLTSMQESLKKVKDNLAELI